MAISRCSAIISGGINRMTRAMPAGTIMRSSTYPSTGTKSGIRSIGDRARSHDYCQNLCAHCAAFFFYISWLFMLEKWKQWARIIRRDDTPDTAGKLGASVVGTVTAE